MNGGRAYFNARNIIVLTSHPKEYNKEVRIFNLDSGTSKDKIDSPYEVKTQFVVYNAVTMGIPINGQLF
jgi:hypothetical protein